MFIKQLPAFSLFLECFSVPTSNREQLLPNLTLSQTRSGFYMSAVQVFLKHCRKRRNCSLRAISPFSTVFYTLLKNFSPISPKLILSPANSFNLGESKNCRMVLNLKVNEIYYLYDNSYFLVTFNTWPSANDLFVFDCRKPLKTL